MSHAKRLLQNFNEADFDAEDMGLLRDATKKAKKADMEGKIDDLFNITASDPGFNTPEMKIKNARRMHQNLIQEIELAVTNDHATMVTYIYPAVKMMKRKMDPERILSQWRFLARIGAKRVIEGHRSWDPETPPPEISPAVIEDAAESLMQQYQGEIDLGNYDDPQFESLAEAVLRRLVESSSDLEEEMYAFADQLRAKYGLAKLELFLPKTDTMDLANIEVREMHRGAGTGSKALQEICDFADRHKLKISLTPAHQGYAELAKFYERFGFRCVPVPEGYFGDESMVRQPSGGD